LKEEVDAFDAEVSEGMKNPLVNRFVDRHTHDMDYGFGHMYSQHFHPSLEASRTRAQSRLRSST